MTLIDDDLIPTYNQIWCKFQWISPSCTAIVKIDPKPFKIINENILELTHAEIYKSLILEIDTHSKTYETI
jgi:hypothetical protein